MSLTRTKKRASTKAPEMEQVQLEKAYILPAQIGDQLKVILLEMPYKYGQMISPMMEALNNAIRTDVNVNVMKEEKQSSPAKAAVMKPPGEIPSKVKPEEIGK